MWRLSWRNLPNQLTLFRLILAVAFFTLLSLAGPAEQDGWIGTHRVLLLDVAFAIFFVAGVTDYLDGLLARRWNVTSTFGRIADPFADKITILGGFILLVPLDAYVEPWMVLIILGRELLVNGIRGFAESQGVNFSASQWGKWKMVFQSLAVGSCVLIVAHPEGIIYTIFNPFAFATIVLTLVTTVFSGGLYVVKAMRLFKTIDDADDDDAPSEKNEATTGTSA